MYLPCCSHPARARSLEAAAPVIRAFNGLMPTRYVEVRRRFLREHPGHVLDSGPLPAD
jgi:hypothetical protein